MRNETTYNTYDAHCLSRHSGWNILTMPHLTTFGTTSYRSGRTETEVSLKRYKYVGKERDEETGLYYYGARYYASWIARFVSVDPLQHDYPIYTPYQYAGNMPVTYIDLDGLEPIKAPLPNGRMVELRLDQVESVSNFIVKANNMLMNKGIAAGYPDLNIESFKDYENGDEIMKFMSFAQHSVNAYSEQDKIKDTEEKKSSSPKATIEDKILQGKATTSEITNYQVKNVASMLDAVVPDAIGMSINVNINIGGGFGGEISGGLFESGDLGLFATGKAGSGFDISFGVSIWAVESQDYDFGPKTLIGPGVYQSSGAGFLSESTFHSVSENDGSGIIGSFGRSYNGIAVGLTVGTKSIAGGSFGVSYTVGGSTGNLTKPSDSQKEDLLKQRN